MNKNEKIPKHDKYPRVKNGKVFPLRFRHLYTVEQVLKAKREREEANLEAGNIGAFSGKKQRSNYKRYKKRNQKLKTSSSWEIEFYSHWKKDTHRY